MSINTTYAGVVSAPAHLSKTEARKLFKEKKVQEERTTRAAIEAQQAATAARQSSPTGFSPRHNSSDDDGNYLMETEESQFELLTREVAYLKNENSELDSKCRTLSEKVDTYAKDLNAENDRAVKAEQDKEAAIAAKEAAETKLEAVLVRLAAAKNELETSKTRTDVAELKGRLEELTKKLNALKDEALKAITKGELPESYKSKQSQGENHFFSELRIALNTLIPAVTTCDADYRTDAPEMKQVIDHGHQVADNWNADNVMLAQAKSISTWLNEVIQTPLDVRIFSQKIDTVRARLNAFVARDLMDNTTFHKMLETATQSLSVEDKQKLTDEKKLALAKEEFQRCGDTEKRQLIAKEYAALMDELKGIQAMRARIEEKTISQPNQSKITALLQKLNELAVQEAPKETNNTENCELYRETVRTSLTKDFSTIYSTQKQLYVDLRDTTTKTWNQALNQSKVLEQDLELLNDRIGLIRSLNDMFEEINAIKGGAIKTYAVSPVDQLKKDLGDLEPQFLSHKDALLTLRDRFLLLDGKYASMIESLDSKLRDKKAEALNAELQAYGVNVPTPKEMVMADLVKTTQALRQSIFDQRTLLNKTWDAMKLRLWDTGKDLNYIDSKIKGERNFLGGGRFHEIYYAINTPPAPKAEAKPAAAKTDAAPAAKTDAAPVAPVVKEDAKPADGTTAAVTEPAKDKKD